MPGPAGHLVDRQLLHRRRRQQLQADLHQLRPPVAGRAPQADRLGSGGGVTGRSCRRPLGGGRGQQPSDRVDDELRPLLGQHVPGALDDVQVGVGQRLGQLAAVPLRA